MENPFTFLDELIINKGFFSLKEDFHEAFTDIEHNMIEYAYDKDKDCYFSLDAEFWYIEDGKDVCDKGDYRYFYDILKTKIEPVKKVKDKIDSILLSGGDLEYKLNFLSLKLENYQHIIDANPSLFETKAHNGLTINPLLDIVQSLKAILKLRESIRKKEIIPSTSAPQTSSKSKSSIENKKTLRDNTVRKYKMYVDYFDGLTKKGIPAEEAMKKTCEQFNISEKTLERAFK